MSPAAPQHTSGLLSTVVEHFFNPAGLAISVAHCTVLMSDHIAAECLCVCEWKGLCLQSCQILVNQPMLLSSLLELYYPVRVKAERTASVLQQPGMSIWRQILELVHHPWLVHDMACC